MAVKLLIGCSHSKFIYKDSSKEEIKKSETILKNEFTFKDKTLENDWRVKKGLMSADVSFYNKERNILPTGFIPFYFKNAKQSNLELEVIDTRHFPVYDNDFLNQEHIVINGKTARDYQREILQVIIKYKGGVIDSPPGTGKTLSMAMVLKLYPKSKILIILDRVSLIHQAYKEFTEQFGFSKKEIGMIQGQNVDYEDKRIIFLSIDSYHKAFDLFPDVDIIISDECFTYQTKVLTKNGLKKIGDLVKNKSNDLVLSFNKELNTFEYKPIVGWLEKHVDKILLLQFKGANKNNINCTSNHKFYVYENYKVIQKTAGNLTKKDNIILNKNIKYKRGITSPLTKTQFQILIGKILGDGNLATTKYQARFKFCQGEKQLEYLNFCREAFSTMGFEKLVKIKSGYGGESYIYHSYSRSSEEIKKIYDKVYINKIKTADFLLKNLDEIALAFWFMDDGWLSTHENAGSLSTHNFTYKENLKIKKIFKQKFNIDPTITEDKRINKFYLKFNSKEIKKLSFLIRRYVPKYMEYKILKEDRGYFDFIVDKNDFIIKKIISKKTKKYTKKQKVFDLTVQDNHNYLVGPENILVSNCHSSSVNDTAEKIFFSCQKASVRIGFTGSPEGDNEYSTARMISVLGPIIFQAPIKEKISQGYLSNVDIHIHVPNFEPKPSVGIWQDVYQTTPIEIEEIEKYEAEGKEIVYHYNKPCVRELAYRGDEYELFIDNDERNEFLANLCKDKNKVLYLFSKIQHGQNIYQKILKFKPKAIFLSGINSQKDREDAIDYLNKDKDSVVVASSIFTTGVNIVGLEHAVICGGFKETKTIIQSVGRVTRKIVGIKEKATVHDINDHSINRIAGRQFDHRLRVYKDIMELPIKYFNY